MVDCLNRLSCAAAEPGPIGHVEASRAPPTAPQAEALATASARVRRAGPCPDDLSPPKALQELLKSKDLYSQEPQHLAEYDPDRLKILRTVAQPLPANTLLPPEEAAVLKQPAALALNSEELEQRCATHTMPKPYWDPRLRSPSTRRDFLRRLASVGLLCGTDKVEAEVGFFCVKKKEDQQRLIVDCRAAKFMMRLPPRTKLGSAAAMAELRTPDNVLPVYDEDNNDDDTIDGLDGLGEVAQIELLTSAADVDDRFYQFATPQLASWFAIRELVDPTEFGVTKIWDSEKGKLRDVAQGERCYLGFACLPMGWSWALHFCHTAVSYLARYRQNIPE